RNLCSHSLLLNLLQFLLDTSLSLLSCRLLGLVLLALVVIWFLLCSCERWIGADLLMSLLVHVLQSISGDIVLEIFGELTLVFLLIVFLKGFHVLLIRTLI